MALTFAKKKDRDWFPFIAEDGSCKVEVQRIPIGKSREIEVGAHGRLRKLNIREGTMQWDTEKQTLVNRELAAFALLSFDKDAETDITTEALAKAINATNPEKTVQVGDHICLAGVTLTEDVKMALFEEAPVLVGWLLERSRKLHTNAKEEEAGNA